MPFIRSISGIRATILDHLTPQIVLGYTVAFSKYCGDGLIVVGRDGRPSGEWIENLVNGAILKTGNESINLGIVPTPTVQMMVESLHAVGGISITASHNPDEWNGLKFLNKDGTFLNESEIEKVFNYYDSNSQRAVNIDEDADYDYYENANSDHIDSVLNLKIFKDSDLLSKIHNRKFKVVVDAVNASGSVIIPQLLKNFGCEVIELYCNSTGIFPHTPEPLPQNLTELSKSVVEHKADLGISVDPDADRLVLIDENGNTVSEEFTIALCTWSIMNNFKHYAGKYKKTICVNQSTSITTDAIASKYEAKVLRSAVGEINVVELMKKTSSVLGGEGSGGVILPDLHYGRDSLVGISLILALSIQEGLGLRELINYLPSYSMKKTKVNFVGNFTKIKNKIIAEYKNYNMTTNDGVRIDFGDSWIHCRSSNTEPIIRIIAESSTEEETDRLINNIVNLVKNN